MSKFGETILLTGILCIMVAIIASSISPILKLVWVGVSCIAAGLFIGIGDDK
jgi:hypothetical protein